MAFEIGNFYRVDTSKVPHSTALPRSLKSIKVVMVNHKSDENMTVVFPSNQSLRNFFGYSKKDNGLMQPSLDEHYVMSLNLGKKLLTQSVSFEEFAVKRGKRSFWVDCNDDDDGDDDDNIEDRDDHDHDGGDDHGLVAVKWETRKRTTMYGKGKDVGKKIMTKVPLCMVKEDVEEKKEVLEKTRILKKRKCQFKGVKYGEKKKKIKPNKDDCVKKFKETSHRWTNERYKLAEKNMLRILKEKGAGPRNPILRPDLRTEARKLIGDTGLLDHLLKHMAGKLAPSGKERFRRRHNPQGAMEYWVESADLIETRKQAGVSDPYWVPPPGWKLGDCPNQDPVCGRQLKELRIEVSAMKRDLEELTSKHKVNNQAINEESLRPLQALHDDIMLKKAQIEKKLLKLSKCYSEMEDEIGSLKESVTEEKEGKDELMADVIAQDNDKTIVEAEKITEDKEEEIREESLKPSQTAEEKKEIRRQKLKSGFRICKPQGTFLWPSQMGCPSTSSSQVVVHLEDLLGYPAPPSACSTSSSRLPLILTPPPQPPCHEQPKPTVKKPMATKAAVTLSFSVANIRGSTTIESISSPTSANTATTIGCSSDAQTCVPDLNEVPLSSFT